MITAKRRRQTAYIIKRRLKQASLSGSWMEKRLLKKPGLLKKRTALGHKYPHWCCNAKSLRKNKREEMSAITQMAAEAY